MGTGSIYKRVLFINKLTTIIPRRRPNKSYTPETPIHNFGQYYVSFTKLILLETTNYLAFRNLFLLETIVAQFEWKYAEGLHKLMDKIAGNLNNNYKNVRDKIGQ